MAYVGGGFGVGIHNLLEAAVWDVPVFFGPNNQKFQEAQGLKKSGGFEINNYEEFAAQMIASLPIRLISRNKVRKPDSLYRAFRVLRKRCWLMSSYKKSGWLAAIPLLFILPLRSYISCLCT